MAVHQKGVIQDSSPRGFGWLVVVIGTYDRGTRQQILGETMTIIPDRFRPPIVLDDARLMQHWEVVVVNGNPSPRSRMG